MSALHFGNPRLTLGEKGAPITFGKGAPANLPYILTFIADDGLEYILTFDDADGVEHIAVGAL